MKFFSLIFLCLISPVLLAAELHPQGYAHTHTQAHLQTHPEKQLLDAINDIQGSDFLSAEKKLERLVKAVPDFKLAQLVYADVLKSKVDAFQSPGSGLPDGLEKTLLLTEIKNRYQAEQDVSIKKNIPSVLSKLDSFYHHAIVIDLKKSRLYLFKNAQPTPVLVDDFFVSMGRSGAGKIFEGDLKTPLGVYFVQSYIRPGLLDDKYGAGAYPINYPNAWDRLNGKTGHGIWLHGTRSGTYNRPVLASEGCVVLPNPDLLSVGRSIDLKSTPVLIGEDIKWLSADQWQAHKIKISELHKQWKDDWQSMDVEKYLSHYSKRFTTSTNDFTYWADHKRRVAKHKTFVDVELSNVSLLQHPNEDVMVATFLQTYASDNFSSKSWKRQYWNKESDGQWRIVFEDKISAPVEAQLAVN